MSTRVAPLGPRCSCPASALRDRHDVALIPIFDLDGTLLDSDEALAAAFVSLGVPREQVTFGHVVAHECDRLGLALDDYLAAYDVDAAAPYEGVTEILGQLDRWAVCSNKHGPSARTELERLGWEPEVALFADFFRGPKVLGPVIDALGVEPSACVFIGDTGHDLACARAVGMRFAVAAWNPRAEGLEGDDVLRHPRDILSLIG